MTMTFFPIPEQYSLLPKIQQIYNHAIFYSRNNNKHKCFWTANRRCIKRRQKKRKIFFWKIKKSVTNAQNIYIPICLRMARISKRTFYKTSTKKIGFQTTASGGALRLLWLASNHIALSPPGGLWGRHVQKFKFNIMMMMIMMMMNSRTSLHIYFLYSSFISLFVSFMLNNIKNCLTLLWSINAGNTYWL